MNLPHQPMCNKPTRQKITCIPGVSVTLRVSAFVVALFLASEQLLFVSELRADDANKETDVVTFDDHIKPVLRRHCLKCHGNDEQNADLNLQSYSTLMTGGSAGAVVKAGRPDASILFRAITSDDDAARMPPESPPIPKEHIELIRRWIATGLRETSLSKSLAPSRTVTFNPAANAAMKPAGPPPMPHQLPDIDRPGTKRRLPVLALAASPWAPLVAASGYQHIRLLDMTTEEEIGALPFPEGIPQVLRFSRNGAVLLAAGGKPVQSGSAVLFDVRTGNRLAQLGDELDSVMAADISPDQQMVALGGTNRSIKVYATKSGRVNYQLTRHTDWITAVAFSPDGKQLASADRAGGIHLWDAESGGILLSLVSHQSSVRSLAWRNDSKLLASGGDDGRLTWWNAEDGFISVSHTNPHPPARPAGVYGRIPNGVLDVSFSPTGQLLSCGRDGFGRLWNPAGGQQKSFEITAATPTQVAVGQNGTTLVIGDSAGNITFRKTSE